MSLEVKPVAQGTVVQGADQSQPADVSLSSLAGLPRVAMHSGPERPAVDVTEERPRALAVWTPIADIARACPTPHNTQPIRIVPRGSTTADLLIDPARMLPEEDHGNLYLAATVGIMAVTLERAAAACGRKLEVELVQEVTPAALTATREPKVVARVRIVGDCKPQSPWLLEERRTSRGVYDGKQVGDPTLFALRDIARAHGQRFVWSQDRKVVKRVVWQNAEAMIDNLQLGNERREIEGWFRWGKTPQHGDGLWREPMIQPAWELKAGFRLPWLFSLPGLRQLASWKYVKTQAGTSQVGLLCGGFRTFPELYQAGRGLMQFWLEMTRHGAVMHPFGSMLTNASHAARVARDFGVNDCWLIFRFGYSEKPLKAPRLPSILMDPDEVKS